MPLALGEGGLPFAGADVVDDFPHPLAKRRILHAEFLNEAAVVDQIVS